jgi:hypothetical protein
MEEQHLVAPIQPSTGGSYVQPNTQPTVPIQPQPGTPNEPPAQGGGSTTAMIGNQAYLVCKFTGNDDYTVHQFLHALTTAKFLGAWSDEQTLAVATLRLGGEALEYVESTPRARSSWENFQSELKEHFQRRVPTYVAERKFQQCRQLPNESVRAYEARLRLLGRRFLVTLEENGAEPSEERLNTFESTLVRIFLYGLKPDLRRFVMIREPTTMRDAVRYAITEEANMEADEETIPRSVAAVAQAQQLHPRSSAARTSSNELYLTWS